MGSHAGTIKVAAARTGMPLDEYLARIAAGEKFCWKCRSWKLRTGGFAVDRSRTDGLTSTCLDCRRVRVHVNTKGRPSPMRGKTHTETARAEMATAHKGQRNHRWKGGTTPRDRDPQRVLARRAVNHAVEAGRLARPALLPCFDCGESAAEYDHYRGYEPSHWLEVQAVCKGCHRKREKSR